MLGYIAAIINHRMPKRLQKTAEFNKKNIGILNPEQFKRDVHMSYFEPGPAVAPFVAHYVIARWDMHDGAESTISDVLSQPVVQILFGADGARIMGVTNGRRKLTLKGSGVYAVVRFRPGGFHPFWHGSMLETTESIVPLSEIAPQVGPKDISELLSQEDHEIAQRIELWLESMHPLPDKRIELVNAIIARVETDRTITTVQAVSDAFAMSERTLQELFMTYVGVGIKWMIMRIRFLGAIELAHTSTKPSWTTIAAELGYSTQSHFNNDFKKIMGETPSAYMKAMQ